MDASTIYMIVSTAVAVGSLVAVVLQGRYQKRSGHIQADTSRLQLEAARRSGPQPIRAGINVDATPVLTSAAEGKGPRLQVSLVSEDDPRESDVIRCPHIVELYFINHGYQLEHEICSGDYDNNQPITVTIKHPNGKKIVLLDGPLVDIEVAQSERVVTVLFQPGFLPAGATKCVAFIAEGKPNLTDFIIDYRNLKRTDSNNDSECFTSEWTLGEPDPVRMRFSVSRFTGQLSAIGESSAGAMAEYDSLREKDDATLLLLAS